MKKSTVLFGIMLLTTVIYVFAQNIIFTIIDVNTGDNHILASTVVSVVYVLLSLVLPMVIIFGIKSQKPLNRFAYGLIGFSITSIVYYIVRNNVLLGDEPIPNYVVSTLFLIVLTAIYLALIGYMVYQLYLYWKDETNTFVKFNLVLIVVSLTYNLQVFNILRYKYLSTVSISALRLYTDVTMFVMIVLQFLSALMVYTLALKNEENVSN